MAKNNMVIWLIVGVIAVFAWQSGWLNFGSDNAKSPIVPSDLTTTVTLNTGDMLATSATNTNVSYYVFSSDGAYLKEGTTGASGTASFTVPVNGVYSMILYADGATTDYLAQEVSFNTNDGSATKTINVDLIKESTVDISSLRDPVDLDNNITRTAGSTVSFDILYSVNTSNAAINKPIIVATANQTAVDSVSISGYSVVDCPRRLSVSSGYELWCFASSAQIKSSDGVQTAKASALLNAVSAPVNGSNISVTIIDQGIYRESAYKTLGKSAFKYGAENPSDRTDVGAKDSDAGTIILVTY